MTVNKQFEQVKEFHAAAGIQMPNKPTYMVGSYEDFLVANELQAICDQMRASTDSPVQFRASLILEELIEFISAKELEDQVDALTDISYLTVGTFTLLGVEPEWMFNIVQFANMGKKWPDGKMHFDENGKIVKPPGWAENFSPERYIKAEIERQSKGK